MKGEQERELTLSNIYDKEDILCDYCQKLMMEGYDELILYWDLLYHAKCWESQCNDW